MLDLAEVSLRPETPADQAFLLDLYLSVREDELGFRDLSPLQRKRLLEQQLTLQIQDYRVRFPNAWFTIITVNGKPAGRLYVSRQPHELRIIDISLLPAYRGHGIGSQLLKSIQAESIQSNVPVRLWVMHDNPAHQLYTKLGFQSIRGNELRTEMEWRA